MERLPQSRETYDRIFSAGGTGGAYHLPYRHSIYYKLFKVVFAELVRHRVQSVLEVGCGPGGFAQMLMEHSRIAYRGFDFSEVAIAMARAKTGKPEAFFVGDATHASSYAGADYDCVVCTEVLEHVDQDREVIANWPPGVFCACSVPNFDAPTHVHLFTSEAELRARYSGLLDITLVRRVKLRALTDTSLANTLRSLRWSRYRPRELMAIMGWGSFESLGGWFFFSGFRRST